MTRAEAAQYLSAFQDFLVTSHEGPDADGLGAAYALTLGLQSIGKNARLSFSAQPSAKFRFIDRRGLFSRLEEREALRQDQETACLIILDTHDLNYIGGAADELRSQARGLLVIDHHEVQGQLGAGFWVDSTASSTCELVHGLLKELGAPIPDDAAEALFAGIVYDTGSFSYAKTRASTFEAALELVRLGVNPYAIHNRMYESASIGLLILQKLVYSSLELRLDNKAAVQTLSRQDLAVSGASYEDAEDLVNLPLRGRTVEVSLLFKENLEGKMRCSLRSKGKVNVAHIAQLFGGGGHKTAAGFTCDRPLEAMKRAVLENIERALEP